MSDELSSYDQAAQGVVEHGNRLAEADPAADVRDIADGLLAGAIQYWLYSYQPCGDPGCEDCAPLATAQHRLAELQRLVESLARNSEYFHSVNDTDVGRA